LDHRARCNANTLQDRRIRTDPNVVLDHDRPAHEGRSRSTIGERRAGHRVRHPAGRVDGVEVGIDDGGMPPDDDAMPDDDRAFADEKRILGVAVVADLDVSLTPHVEQDAVEPAAGADHQPWITLGGKTLERERTGDIIMTPSWETFNDRWPSA